MPLAADSDTVNVRFSDSAALGESIDSDGGSSSSVIVPTPVAVPSAALPGLLSVTRTVSFASSSASSVTCTVIVLVVSPALNVSVGDAGSVA